VKDSLKVAGDAPAWRQLYDSQFEFVERICRRLGTPDGELDDVVQETFLVDFKKLGAFSEGRVSTWLYRIAANVVSSRHRRRRVRSALYALFGRSEPPPQRAADAEYDAREAQAAVASVLERMAPKKREVFALYELEGLSGEQIAERVGCKVDTVWTRLHYARADFERIAKKRGLP
jgi:RNA polymerase sigma-70 factor, ECF subfamily